MKLVDDGGFVADFAYQAGRKEEKEYYQRGVLFSKRLPIVLLRDERKTRRKA